MFNDLFLAERYPFLNKVVLQGRIAWSIRLRWAAVFTFFITFLLANYAFKLNLPFYTIFVLLISLALFNLLCYLIFKWVKEFSLIFEIVFLTIQILFDLIILTVLLNMTGGIDNPLYLFYLFHVILSSIILPRKIPYIVSTLIIFLFGSLIYLEKMGLVEHNPIFGLSSQRNGLYTFLVLLIFTITVYICTYITTTFMAIFRKSKIEVQNLNKKLIEADRIKTDFFKFTSHELKSPLIAIKSALDSVIKVESATMDRRPLEVLIKASHRAQQMLSILKELLELVKNKRLVSQPSQDITDINSGLKKIIENEKERIDEKKIKVHYNLCKEDCCIPMDYNDFYALFSNLINNAINYTPENGFISIETMKKEAESIIKISDSGIGIPETDYNKIFSEFYRSENAKKYVSFGPGLGLSIVKQILENQNGKIDISSKIGGGTSFLISLPFNRN
jgi:signal transduction histidine kinase